MALQTTRRPSRFWLASLALLLGLAFPLLPGCSSGDSPEADSPAAENDAAPDEAAVADAHGAGGGHGADPAADEADEPDEPLPPGETPFDTTYLDVDTELFVYAQVADIIDSSLVQTLAGGQLGALDEIQEEIGIDPREIVSVTVGVSEPAGLQEKATESIEQFNPMGGMGMGPGITTMPETGSDFGAGVGPDSQTRTESPSSASRPGSSAGMHDADRRPRGGSAPGTGAGQHDAERPGRGSAPGSSAGQHDADRSPRSGSGSATGMHDADRPSRGGSTPSTESGEASSGSEPAGRSASAGVVAVVRTKTEIELDHEGLEQLTHEETTYYRHRDPEGDLAACLYLVEPNTLVVSDEDSIKEIIDQGAERARPTADLGFVKTLPHLLIAAASADNQTLLKDLATRQDADSGGSGSPGRGGADAPGEYAGEVLYDDYEDPAGDEMEMYEEGFEPGYGSRQRQQPTPELDFDPEIFAEHTQAAALLVSLTDGIGLEVALRCDSAESAGEVHTAVEENLAQIRQQYELARDMLPGIIQQLAQPLVDSLAAQNNADVVTVSTHLPEDKQPMLAMLPMAVMGMMMSGGLQMDSEFEAMADRRELAQQVRDQGQPAANADDLPDGLEVMGLARWGRSRYGDQAPPPLEIALVAQNGPAAQAIGFGKLELTEALVDDDHPLKWLGIASDPFDGDLLQDFIPIERDGMFSDHPEDGIVTGFLVAPPAEAVSSLQVVSGQLMLQVASGTEEILVRDVAGIRGEIEDDRLKDARISIDASGLDRGELEVAWNESPLLGKIEPVTADGSPVETFGSSWFESGGRKTMTYSFAGPPPDDLALRVVTHADLQEVAVPFRLENLPLPEPQELSELQQALLVWTRGVSPSDHPDLIIEAQGRWRMLEPVDPVSMPQMAGQPGRPGSEYPGGLEAGMEEMESYETPDAYPDAYPEGYSEGRRRSSSRQGSAGSSRSGLAPASEEPLRILIDLTGPLAQAAEAVGEVEIASAKTDIDTELAFEGAEIADKTGDPVGEFIDLTGEDLSGEFAGPAETPPGTLRVITNLTPPSQTIGGISQINGSVTLRTVRERTETLITDLQSRLGEPQGDPPVAQKSVSHRELARFGLKPLVRLESDRILMTLLDGKDERISDVTLVDLNGLPITDVDQSIGAGTGSARGKKVYTFAFPGRVPQKIGMKISVNMGVKDIKIPIRIRDMPLPPMPEETE